MAKCILIFKRSCKRVPTKEALMSKLPSTLMLCVALL